MFFDLSCCPRETSSKSFHAPRSYPQVAHGRDGLLRCATAPVRQPGVIHGVTPPGSVLIIIGCTILCEAILREGIFGMGRLHPLQGVVVKCGAGGELARKDCLGTSTPQLPQGAEDCPGLFSLKSFLRAFRVLRGQNNTWFSSCLSCPSWTILALLSTGGLAEDCALSCIEERCLHQILQFRHLYLSP